MGKASSAKKVARVARGKSAKRSARGRQLGFPLAVGALIILGVLLVVFLRGSNNTSSANAFPSPFTPEHPNGDHIHMAYGVDVCGKWLPPIPTTPEGEGIHTHGDGVMHIHPSTTKASGKHAQLKVWLANVHMTVTPDRLVVPRTTAYPGTVRKAGGSCDGKKATIRVALWDKAVTGKGKPTTKPPSKIYTKDFGDIWLGHNGGAITIFYGPPDAKIPLPNDSAIRYLIEAEGGSDRNVAPSSTVPQPSTSAGQSSTTTAGQTSTTGSTSTTK